jgi:hypothetical protein
MLTRFFGIVPWDDFGTFCAVGRFFGTFCAVGRLVRGTFSAWDVLRVGRFESGTF